jgi:mannose-6-phosphate isomerase-like protein (cupin superfamily)
VRHLLQKEDCLFIPDGAVHSVKALGAETLKTIVFMAPYTES